jgi:hypothetical protein
MAVVQLRETGGLPHFYQIRWIAEESHSGISRRTAASTTAEPAVFLEICVE